MKRFVFFVPIFVLLSTTCSLTNSLISTPEQVAETTTVPSAKPEAKTGTPIGQPTFHAPPSQGKPGSPCGNGVCEGPENARNCPQDCLLTPGPFHPEGKESFTPNPLTTKVEERYTLTNPASGASLAVYVNNPTRAVETLLPAVVLVPGGSGGSSQFRKPRGEATILAGTNDLIGSSAWHRSLFYMLIKRLPRRPSLGWARQNMHTILTELKNRTRAIIGVASIPPLGEDLNSHSVARVRAYNGMLKRIAERQKVAYLPVFERMEAYLKAADRTGRTRRYRGSLVIEAEFVYRRLIVGQDYDEFSASKGFVILNDGVHLNNRGAALVADEIETFLRANTTATSSQNETKKFTQPIFLESD